LTRPPSHTDTHCQRALGRLLSAAREPAPTQLVRSRRRTFFRPRLSGLRA
jgi:hypothetical protein